MAGGGTSGSGVGVADPVDTQLADRFLTAWKRVETFLVDQLGERSAGDMNQLLRTAERRRLVTPDAEDFLQACRRARNAYAHIAFDGYSGPVALPPRAVVERLERLAVALTSPGRAARVASRARTCDRDDTVAQALATMHAGDFSQLPYLHPQHGWVLFSRHHVAAMVGAAADRDPAGAVDLTATLVSVAEDPRIGVTVPVVLPSTATATAAVEAFELTLATPDALPGGYPAVLLVDPARPTDAPAILTVDDLPRLYQMLGR